MKEYIKIYTGTIVLVNRLAFLLDEANIVSLVKDPCESGRLAGFGTPESSIELFVLDDDAESAITIVKKFEKEILK